MMRCLTAVGLIGASALLAGCSSYTVNLDQVQQRRAASAYEAPPSQSTRRVATRTRSNPTNGGDVTGSVGQAPPPSGTPDDPDKVNQAIYSICRGC
jgi:hypothetical protein